MGSKATGGGGGGGGKGGFVPVIDIGSSSSSGGSDTESDSGVGKRPARREAGGGEAERKRARVSAAAAAVPPGFLEPLTPERLRLRLRATAVATPPRRRVTKQFWNAGDYDGKPELLGRSDTSRHSDSGMEHVRVHPKFLHSNATSHKWALGALAELLDNSLDEVANGATYVNIDVTENKKDGARMLFVEDDGGGMDPDKMRHCMSLGYSEKSKVKNAIGQYGNGFKTSTMRLGADVLVFSRSFASEGRRHTQSIGMLSYTFLRSTDRDDVIVPMIDYEKGQSWRRKVRTTLGDWHTSLETIIQWSPYSTEAELIQEFSSIKEQGTRIVIYNLWEDEQGELELDFDADVEDIQIKGANRDQENIQMATRFPNSRHFFTYKYSLRSYASILYLRVPSIFRMILRGKEIEHHNIIGGLMMKNQVTYKPVTTDGFPTDANMATDVIIGFIKDAKHHIPIQGFNVYHKNRLIKPFWRVWSIAGSQGRGIVGVLEVNFVEPAHDKQDFERTKSLSRLEARLTVIQKKYWLDNCHRIGYGGSRDNKKSEGEDKGCGKSNYFHKFQSAERSYFGSSNKNRKTGMSSLKTRCAIPNSKQFSPRTTQQTAEILARTVRTTRQLPHDLSNINDNGDAEIAEPPSRSICRIQETPEKSLHNDITSFPSPPSCGVTRSERMTTRSVSKVGSVTNNGDGRTIDDPETVIKQLKDENSLLKKSIMKLEESFSMELQMEQDKNNTLTQKMEDAQKQLEAANEEQEALIEIFTEERMRRDQEMDKLRTKLKEASSTIHDLSEKLKAARSCHKS